MQQFNRNVSCLAGAFLAACAGSDGPTSATVFTTGHHAGSADASTSNGSAAEAGAMSTLEPPSATASAASEGRAAEATVTGGPGDGEQDSGASPEQPPAPGRVLYILSPHGPELARYLPQIEPDGTYDLATSEYLATLAPLQAEITLLTGVENVIVEGGSNSVADTSGISMMTGLRSGSIAFDEAGGSRTLGFQGYYPEGPSIEHALSAAYPQDIGEPIVLCPDESVLENSARNGVNLVSFDGSGDAVFPLSDPSLLVEGPSIDVPDGDAGIPVRFSAFLDGLAELFSREQDRRVAFLWFSHPEPYFTVPWIDGWSETGSREFWGGILNGYMHGASRYPDEGQVVTNFWRWQAEQLAGFAQQLADTPLAGGSVLDHTLIVWLTAYGGASPGAHWRAEIPVLLIGGSALNPGTGAPHIDAAGYNQADLHLSVAARAGYPLDSFGDPSLAAEHIPGVVGAR